LSLYLDASILVALFSNDSFTSAADAALRGRDLPVMVSDFAAAEFASAIGRRARNKELSTREAAAAFAAFDGWLGRGATPVEIAPADVRMAERFVRQLWLALRAPDAIHIAMAHRFGAELATFDSRMAAAAAALGVSLFSA
jgi:predicted nucleic acid-binding protein